jgi:hypothetical protein
MKHLLIILTLTGCSYLQKHEAKDDSAVDLTALKAKYETVYSEVESELDPATGWPSVHDCDGLLWSGIACSVGMPTRIELSEYSPGEIHRRPAPACWNDTDGDVGSKSTISKDMLLGYSMCLWQRKDLSAFQRLADYGEKNEWIMGKPNSLVSRVLMSPNLIGILGRSIYTLSGGKDDRYYRRTGYLFPKVEADYERHLQVQGILLQDEIDSQYNLTAINGEMLDRLLENADKEPNDPLFAAALGKFTGDQSKALELLLAETVCPTYARGENPELYCKLIWLEAAQILLGE